jgi:hypothetical protein
MAAQKRFKEQTGEVEAASWLEAAETEARDIFYQPMDKTGWAGLGYSVVIWDEARCASFFAIREQEQMVRDFFTSLREHGEHWPLIRYYAALEGASPLQTELLRVERPWVTVVAQLLLRERSVAQTLASEPTMIMVRDICLQMIDALSRRVVYVGPAVAGTC